jgi:MerR family Zn(II)-responsive transcriptional regulator of zntA
VYTIGLLAKRARVSTDKIRFYERQGLIAPLTKTRSGYRLYTDAALRRLLFIKHAQRCSFSLTEIGEFLQMHEADARRRKAAYRLAAEKKREIDRTVTALHAMAAALSALLQDAPLNQENSSQPQPEESPLLTYLENCVAAQTGPSAGTSAPTDRNSVRLSQGAPSRCPVAHQ